MDVEIHFACPVHKEIKGHLTSLFFCLNVLLIHSHCVQLALGSPANNKGDITQQRKHCAQTISEKYLVLYSWRQTQYLDALTTPPFTSQLRDIHVCGLGEWIVTCVNQSSVCSPDSCPCAKQWVRSIFPGTFLREGIFVSFQVMFCDSSAGQERASRKALLLSLLLWKAHPHLPLAETVISLNHYTHTPTTVVT